MEPTSFARLSTYTALAKRRVNVGEHVRLRKFPSNPVLPVTHLQTHSPSSPYGHRQTPEGFI